MAEPGIRPLGRVMRAPEAELYRGAADVLDAARTTAARLTAGVADRIEAERTRARDEVVRETQAEATRQLTQTSARIVHELGLLRVAMAEAIAEGVARVLGSRPDDEVLAEAAAHAIANLQDRSGITVRVAPTHLEAVTASLHGSGLLAGEPGMRVIGDATINEDDCIIETASGFVRAGRTDQLARLREALRVAGQERATSEVRHAGEVRDAGDLEARLS